MTLAASYLPDIDASFRFKLGVGLAKLGMFDLSLRHVSKSVTPWEAPLYRLRAKLIFPPGSSHGLQLTFGDRERAGDRERTVRIGVLAGSFDGIPGRIVLALLEDLPARRRHEVVYVALCFPTPRDASTDRAASLFHEHINLSPDNKTLAVSRIRAASLDLLLMADAALDGRVFALSLERLAPVQAHLWGWGGSLGMATTDYFIVPEVLWTGVQCTATFQRRTDLKTIAGRGGLVLPQDLFHEQVILLEGPPPLPRYLPSSSTVPPDELWDLLQEQYLVPPPNSSHLYLLPTSVRFLHPEFDDALAILLKTDPFAL
eukprot:gene4974-6337_t